MDEYILSQQLQRARKAHTFTEAEDKELDRLAEKDQDNLTDSKEAASREHAQELLQKVRRLGRIPIALNQLSDQDSRAEFNLARQLSDARKAQIFTADEAAELVVLGQTELKTLIWEAYSADGEAMVQLYTAACERLRTGVKIQSAHDERLLEELEWRVQK